MEDQTFSHPVAYHFRHITAPKGFRNINEITDLSKLNWLHPTESLYGNWDGENLILGQDFNSWNNLQGLSADKLCHNPNFQTNKNLCRVFGSNFQAIYGNFFWFIKEGDNASSRFSTRTEVIEANNVIFEATIKGMRNLKRVYCMGSAPYRFAFWQKFIPLSHCRTIVFKKDLDVYALPHLGNLGLNNFANQCSFDRSCALERISSFVSETLV